MLERGEIHLCIGLLDAVEADDRHFGIYPVPPLELLAACHPSFPLERGSDDRHQPRRVASVASADSGFVLRKTFDAVCRLARLKPNILIESRAPTLAGACRGRAWGRDHSIAVRTHRYTLRTRPHYLQGQTASRAARRRVGQAARASALCPGLLRNACCSYAQALPDGAAVGAQGGRRGEELAIELTYSLRTLRIRAKSANRFLSRSPSYGTNGACFCAMPRNFTNCLPCICTSSSRPRNCQRARRTERRGNLAIELTSRVPQPLGEREYRGCFGLRLC